MGHRVASAAMTPSRHSGMTLLELMIALTAGLIVLGALLPAWQELNRLILKDAGREEVTADRARALTMLRLEVFQAGYGLHASGIPALEVTPDQLQLRADLNHDGDLTDPREWLQYRFDASTHRLLRSSGGSSFQTRLTPVEALEFQATSEACFQVSVQWEPEDAVEVSTFCLNTFQTR